MRSRRVCRRALLTAWQSASQAPAASPRAERDLGQVGPAHAERNVLVLGEVAQARPCEFLGSLYVVQPQSDLTALNGHEADGLRIVR